MRSSYCSSGNRENTSIGRSILTPPPLPTLVNRLPRSCIRFLNSLSFAHERAHFTIRNEVEKEANRISAKMFYNLVRDFSDLQMKINLPAYIDNVDVCAIVGRKCRPPTTVILHLPQISHYTTRSFSERYDNNDFPIR